MDIREKSERCGRPAKLWHRVRDILFQRTDRKRIVWFLFWDVIIILSSLYFAFLLRFDGKIPSSYLEQFRIYAIFFLAVKLPIFYYFRLYHMSWRYVGFYELISVVKATTLSAILLGAIAFLKPNFLFHVFPRSILIIDFLLTLSMVGGLRILKRSYIQVFKLEKNSKHQKRILIVGAGDAGERIVREVNYPS